MRPARASGGLIDDFLTYASGWGFEPRDVWPEVHLWHGASDPLVPVEHALQLAAALPNCRVFIDPDEGHHFFRSSLGEILAALVDGLPTGHTPVRLLPAQERLDELAARRELGGRALHPHAARHRARRFDRRSRARPSRAARPPAPRRRLRRAGGRARCSTAAAIDRREVRGRLVEHDQRRLEHQRAAHRQHLALTAAELARAPACSIRLELREHRQDVLDPGARPRATCSR